MLIYLFPSISLFSHLKLKFNMYGKIIFKSFNLDSDACCEYPGTSIRIC